MRAITITREQLLPLWRKRCPTVTDAELAASFDEWWALGALDVRLDKAGKPMLVLTGKRRRQ
jgi:hypothetical protein